MRFSRKICNQQRRYVVLQRGYHGIVTKIIYDDAGKNINNGNVFKIFEFFNINPFCQLNCVGYVPIKLNEGYYIDIQGKMEYSKKFKQEQLKINSCNLGSYTNMVWFMKDAGMKLNKSILPLIFEHNDELINYINNYPNLLKQRSGIGTEAIKKLTEAAKNYDGSIITAKDNETNIITGIVTGIKYENIETGLIVFELGLLMDVDILNNDIKRIYDTTRFPIIICVAEVNSDIQEACQLTLHGRVVGSKFKADKVYDITMDNELRILNTMVNGAGYRTLVALRKEFGENMWDIIKSEPDKLKGVHGFGSLKVDLLHETIQNIDKNMAKGFKKKSVKNGLWWKKARKKTKTIPVGKKSEVILKSIGNNVKLPQIKESQMLEYKWKTDYRAVNMWFKCLEKERLNMIKWKDNYDMYIPSRQLIKSIAMNELKYGELQHVMNNSRNFEIKLNEMNDEYINSCIVEMVNPKKWMFGDEYESDFESNIQSTYKNDKNFQKAVNILMNEFDSIVCIDTEYFVGGNKNNIDLSSCFAFGYASKNDHNLYLLKDKNNDIITLLNKYSNKTNKKDYVKILQSNIQYYLNKTSPKNQINISQLNAKYFASDSACAANIIDSAFASAFLITLILLASACSFKLFFNLSCLLISFIASFTFDAGFKSVIGVLIILYPNCFILSRNSDLTTCAISSFD